MQKKLTQLTKVGCYFALAQRCLCSLRFDSYKCLQVIKHLNTKGTEDSSNLQQAAGEYEVEIQQILQSTAAQIGAFNKQLALQQEEARIAVVIKV